VLSGVVATEELGPVTGVSEEVVVIDGVATGGGIVVVVVEDAGAVVVDGVSSCEVSVVVVKAAELVVDGTVVVVALAVEDGAIGLADESEMVVLAAEDETVVLDAGFDAEVDSGDPAAMVAAPPRLYRFSLLGPPHNSVMLPLQGMLQVVGSDARPP